MNRPFDRLGPAESDDSLADGVPDAPPEPMPEIVVMSDMYGTVDLEGNVDDDTDPGPVRTTEGRSAEAPPADAEPAATQPVRTHRAADVPTRAAADAPTRAGPTVAPTEGLRPTAVAPRAPAAPAARSAPASEQTVVRPVAPVAYQEHRVRRRRRKWPWVLLVFAVLVGTLGAYFMVSLWQVWSEGRDDGARPADAIVVMGAAQYDGTPSPQLAARLDHVVTLWDEGYAPLVVVTGGNQPGDRFTEAEASAAYLQARGVPRSAMLLENEGANSYESLEAVSGMLADRGLQQVLIVTDPYHALRSRLTAEELGLTAYASPTPSSVVNGWGAVRRQVGEAAGVAVGRVIGFDRLSGLTS